MNIAIIGTNQSDVRGTLTASLCRMLQELRVRPTVIDLDRLMNQPAGSRFGRVKRRLLGWRLCDITSYVLIAVVNTVPHAFHRDFAVESLRRHAPRTPVALVANLYLPSRPHFVAALRKEGHHGLQRYDHYLCSSVHNVQPVPRGPQPFTRIGLKLGRALLQPGERRALRALLDFERPGGDDLRARKGRALEALEMPHEQLRGRMDYADLCARHRQCTLFFLSFGESFGVPVCELQACGTHVVTPSANWSQAHQVKGGIYQSGEGRLNENFIVYDSVDDLKQKLAGLDRLHNPMQVRQRLEADFPHYLNGDPDALVGCLERCRAGQIHADSHRDHPFDGIFPGT